MALKVQLVAREDVLLDGTNYLFRRDSNIRMDTQSQRL